MSPVEFVIENVLQAEGGVGQLDGEAFVTRYGQTPTWLNAHHLPIPESREDAAINYAQWITQIGLYHALTAPDALSLILVNFAVLAGEGRAIRALQAAIGVRPDGVIGPQTRLALQAIDRRRVGQEVLADFYCRLGEVITESPEKAKWAKGWMRRLGAYLRAL